MIDYPCAKINLGLNIVNKRPDGYHNLETVFYPIRLCDKIEINERKYSQQHKEPCLLEINGMEINGSTQDNLVIKAYTKIKKEYPQLPDITVSLTKNIPTQAGMGGGSSDCAFTMTMLNRMFRLNITTTQLQKHAAELGADCAFFINAVPAFATGIGEKLTPIPLDLSKYTFGIVKPNVAISTKEAFANVTPTIPQKCCKDIVMQPMETWKDELINDFEQSIIPQHPEINEIKQELYRMGAVYSAMSGSGSAVFGIFRKKPENLDNIFKGYFTAII